MLGWEGITEFVTVVEKNSFTAASKQLKISTAQVSRQVSALESRLATKLLYRTTRRLTVTDAGKMFYQHCRQALDGLEEAEQTLTNLQSTPRGKLKITAPTTYGENKVIPLVNDFIAQYPELDVDCRLTNQKVDLIEAGFDLAIRMGKLEDSSMIARPLSSRHQYVCASPAYLARNGAPLLLSELDQHNCLKGTLEYWRFQEDGQERNIRVNGNLSCNSGQALRDAALKGLGVVQLPDYYVRDDIEQGALMPLLQQYQPEEEGIWALYPHNRHLSPKVKMLVEYLGENLD